MSTERAQQGKPTGGVGIAPMEFTEVDSGVYHVKYAFRINKDDLIFQFFKREGVGGPFPATFRSKLWEAFCSGLSLEGSNRERLFLEWVPEADSWFVSVSMERMIPPGPDVIKGVLERITGAPVEALA